MARQSVARLSKRFHVKAKPKSRIRINDLKALRRAVKRKDKVTLVRTIRPAARGR
jgi:hypothetical protein